VWVRNGTDAAFAPRFRASVEEADGRAEPLDVVVVDDAGEEVSQAHDVRAHDVTRYRLFLRAPPKSEPADASGELVVSGGDDVDSLSLSVAKKAFADKGVTGALLIPLAPAFVLVLLGGILAVARKEIGLFDSLTSDLDYSKSFASTLTAAGALLGTVIAASVLPEETTTLSKAAFVALNLIFGVGVVVAGLVYTAFQRGVWTDVKPEKDDEEPTRQQRKMEGTVAGFLGASLITVWAVFGELLTIWLPNTTADRGRQRRKPLQMHTLIRVRERAREDSNL
jgi:hypothetical protein